MTSSLTDSLTSSMTDRRTDTDARQIEFPADRRTVFVSTQPGTIAVTGRTLSLRHIAAAIAYSPGLAHSPSSSHGPNLSRRAGFHRSGTTKLART
ncbi:hypothetical protein Uis1B_0772 [Bifidobacterium margollesii]|uniref:Uncharacterized protein n=1 Tax=Bifidobacterium margollesii TaxID=2020964 RepID=A0A2N5JB64_9BIFI|nr:hypothetical protein [Bifidobacterium margollesii]PLS31431.1 hypothetical protein Uis1B_0772 [Bifidobacterium margollesii]